jgi:hypothetical protein
LPLESDLFDSPKVTFPGWRPPVGHVEFDGLRQLIGGNEARLTAIVVEPDRVNRLADAKGQQV